MFVQEFSNCLSDKERHRVSIQLQTISQLSLKQLAIEEFINNVKVEQLDNDLKKLKKD